MAPDNSRKGMNLPRLFQKIWPYVQPYRWLVVATLILTLITSLMAQVNAVVLDRTVDAINALVGAEDFEWGRAARILTVISIILLSKELLSAVLSFAQKYFGERMRIMVSRDLAQAVIEKILTFRMAFFSADNNDPGTLTFASEMSLSIIAKYFVIVPE